MPKKTRELSALEVSRLNTPGLHMVGGVSGLGLQVSPTGARSWVLRVMIGGKRRDIGLGGYPTVTLAMAREKARQKRELIEQGIDPVAESKARKSALAAMRAAEITFDQAAEQFIAAKEHGWRNPKHRQQWRNTIAEYASPVIGNIFVKDIDTVHVLAVLEPLWMKRTETASRLRGRIESILDWCRARGYRSGENPARWKGHLESLLATPSKVQPTTNQPALPYALVGAFVAELRQHEGTAAKALEFAILTAARSGEVRGARWEEIDLDAAVWTIPASRMKAGKEHRVPLGKRAMALLLETPAAERSGIIFKNRNGDALSDMALTAVIRRLNDRRSDAGLPRWIDPKIGGRDITVHGFRSTFRVWVSERTAYPREIAEMALAHVIPNKTEAAYMRGDVFEKRRRLMTDWESYIDTGEQPAEVIPLNATRAAG